MDTPFLDPTLTQLINAVASLQEVVHQKDLQILQLEELLQQKETQEENTSKTRDIC